MKPVKEYHRIELNLLIENVFRVRRQIKMSFGLNFPKLLKKEKKAGKKLNDKIAQIAKYYFSDLENNHNKLVLKIKDILNNYSYSGDDCKAFNEVFDLEDQLNKSIKKDNSYIESNTFLKAIWYVSYNTHLYDVEDEESAVHILQVECLTPKEQLENLDHIVSVFDKMNMKHKLIYSNGNEEWKGHVDVYKGCIRLTKNFKA